MQANYQRKAHVYCLKDPRDGKVYYVGQTTDVENRVRQHMYQANRASNKPLNFWLKELRSNKLKPELTVLESYIVEGKIETAREARWISIMVGTGQPILNMSLNKGRTAKLEACPTCHGRGEVLVVA